MLKQVAGSQRILANVEETACAKSQCDLDTLPQNHFMPLDSVACLMIDGWRLFGSAQRVCC